MSYVMRRCVVAALIAVLAACGSAPKEQFYTLPSVGRGELRSLPNDDYSVAIGPVFVPEVFDRPQFVLRMPKSEVRIAEQVRWAEPLRQGIARAVAANLAHSLNNGRVSPRAQPETGPADYRVIVDVQEFDSAPGETATIEVMWTVRRAKDGEQQTGRARVQEGVAGPGYDELVMAHARAIAEVSRGIADVIRASRQRELAAAATGASR
jgi:uncharacterized lipoprotein YmbA